MRIGPMMAMADGIANMIMDVTGCERIEKDWGIQYRNQNVDTDEYQFIVCQIGKGGKSSIHRHSERHNTFYVLNGQLQVFTHRVDDLDNKFRYYLSSGESISINADVLHSFEHSGNDDVFVLEIYTLAPNYSQLSEPEDDIERVEGGTQSDEQPDAIQSAVA